MPELSQTNILDIIGIRRDWTPVCVMLDRGESFNSALIEIAKQRRWHLISLSTYNGYIPPELELKGALIDGLPDSHLAMMLRQRNVPAVRVGRLPHPQDDILPAVVPDTYAMGQLAAEHFAERDFKHIAFVGRDPWCENKILYEGFAKRAEELGITCHLTQTSSHKLMRLKRKTPEADHWRIERQFIQPWLRELPKPVGLLCFNDILAGRFSLWAQEIDIVIPQELAVLSVGHRPFVSISAPLPLSYVEHDQMGILQSSVDLLEQVMAGKTPAQNTIMIPPQTVVTRDSTDVLAATDMRVIKALRFMWEHVNEDLSVDQIAQHVGVSRRALEYAFKKDVQRGINEEFQRRRLEKARELIISSNLPIAEIAKAMSYSSHSYFCQIFKSAFAVTPAAYRNQHKHG